MPRLHARAHTLCPPHPSWRPTPPPPPLPPAPAPALFQVRHAKFTSLTRPQSCYLPLCSEDDRRLLPLLRQFQELSAWRRAEFPPSFARLEGDALTQYYSGLIHKYMGPGKLQW